MHLIKDALKRVVKVKTMAKHVLFNSKRTLNKPIIAKIFFDSKYDNELLIELQLNIQFRFQIQVSNFFSKKLQGY